ncbi:hypothetical protein AGMMS49944_03800 [Spirochaetia bacterium]|nr:hypothetical protein AGMMS49944_03800 [Spirochaetia bacterium]
MNTIITLVLSLALEIGVDGNLAVQLVLAENSYMEPDRVGVTGDLGIMQLNPDYLDYFVDRYWDKDWEFNWRAPYDNIYVGLKHLKYLLSIPQFNEWQSILAYNAGEGNVIRGTPKSESVEYANRVFAAWRGSR